MEIRVYEVRRFRSGPTSREHLCATHVERRKEIGWRFVSDHPAMFANATCWDCEAAKDPGALQARIDAEDAAKKAAEPPPAPVLTGQRSLF